MEQYVAGVVSCEMPAYFESSALQAQAVAARTYVLWQMKNNRLGMYDVKDDVSSQVYRGATGTNPAGKAAAERSAGVVMIYEWKFLPALYHSTCGGHTMPASHMRGAPIIAPLGGVECGYCRASKRYHWPLVVPESRMEEALAKANLLSGRLLDVRVTNTLEGGWVDTVEVTSDGARKQISGYALRQALGTSELYSTNFTVRKSGDKYVFDGYGFGHGVGLCQWGANGMALAGYNYADIMRHYYPDAEILKIY
jgi:stage II sporulation protein D